MAHSSHPTRPSDWQRAEKALEEFTKLRATLLPLALHLATDKTTGTRDRSLLRHRFGVYIHFYPSGRVARVGRTYQRFQDRLRDYEPNYHGWFETRWIAVIAFEPGSKALILDLEKFLIEQLDPHENGHHRRKRS